MKAITRATATAAKPFAILNAGPRKHHIDANRHKIESDSVCACQM